MKNPNHLHTEASVPVGALPLFTANPTNNINIKPQITYKIGKNKIYPSILILTY